jgi:hypothetical protein
MSSNALPASSTPKGWNLSFWILQVLLAAMFGMAGAMKSTAPIEQLGKSLPWVLQSPVALVRFIGISELAGALGLILPAATRIAPFLTPLAAAGLTVVMVLAVGFHVMHGMAATLGVPVVLGLLTAFVAWGRFVKAPISPRS